MSLKIVARWGSVILSGGRWHIAPTKRLSQLAGRKVHRASAEIIATYGSTGASHLRSLMSAPS
ncbi:MAG: hypothetical protein P4M15_00295, partial [Alphaproteobacteria bacterium]|nr:hypothetical protein [Alphaproteobacteria bacterium]